VFLLAFALPFAQLLVWPIKPSTAISICATSTSSGIPSCLSGLGALLVAALALALGYAQRMQPSPAMAFTVRLAAIGYALPGAVLAVGFFIPVAWLDNLIIDQMRAWTGQEVGQVLGGNAGGDVAGLLRAFFSRWASARSKPGWRASPVPSMRPRRHSASPASGGCCGCICRCCARLC